IHCELRYVGVEAHILVNFLRLAQNEFSSKGPRRPGDSGAMMSNSLLTYAYIKEHPEMAALLFASSVCVGLLLTLLAVSVRVTCRGRQLDDDALPSKSCSQTVTRQEEEEEEVEEEEDDDDDEEGTESSCISTAGRKAMFGWEEVTYVSEASERAERIERRDMIIQEIWMNAYLNGSSLCGTLGNISTSSIECV
uniref:EVA1 domain-containing protein n=1 Tax=Scophthalmus maximus TaxID=52904 RepID=A0A8D3B6R2_SCOMX